jgi:dethiobiotin synthetase
MKKLRGIYVTGTDTDIGKTRVVAAIARAWNGGTTIPTVVKFVQTGIPPGKEGDAQLAARLAGTRWAEPARFRAPADPWSAALAESRRPLRARELANALRPYPEPLVAEGSGGAAVPLNECESLSDVAVQLGLPALIVVGLRLGCINHAVLTISYLQARNLRVSGLVLVERWEPVTDAYRDDVRRALTRHAAVLGTIPFEPDPHRTITTAAPLFAPLLEEERPSITRS